MALAKKCDLCGTFYDHDVAAKHNGIAFGKNSAEGYSTVEKLQDCCPKCMSDIKACIDRCRKRPEVR